MNWRGDGQEFALLSANAKEGGMIDGNLRRVVMLPDDGHPDLTAEVMNVTGDARDEVIVWDQKSVWIYTQDRPFTGKRIYAPLRNPSYNNSNYHTGVSLPNWQGRERNGMSRTKTAARPVPALGHPRQAAVPLSQKSSPFGTGLTVLMRPQNPPAGLLLPGAIRSRGATLAESRVLFFASSGESVGDAGFRDAWEIALGISVSRTVSMDPRLLLTC